MKITSSAFAEGASIPSKYTCDGSDTIPPLLFEGIPERAVSLALVMDHPDAPMGTWDHWVMWNIPRDTAEVREGTAPRGEMGKNSWKKNAWGGPCPPDREHRYSFRLYALDTTLDLPSSTTKAQLEKAMQGHIVEQAQLMGRYDRKKKS